MYSEDMVGIPRAYGVSALAVVSSRWENDRLGYRLLPIARETYACDGVLRGGDIRALSVHDDDDDRWVYPEPLACRIGPYAGGECEWYGTGFLRGYASDVIDNNRELSISSEQHDSNVLLLDDVRRIGNI